MNRTLTTIVGEGFHPGAPARRAQLKTGEELVLMREPSNLFDKNAVAVMSDDGIKLGYVPRQDAPTIAKAIDHRLNPRCICMVAGSRSIDISWG